MVYFNNRMVYINDYHDDNFPLSFLSNSINSYIRSSRLSSRSPCSLRDVNGNQLSSSNAEVAIEEEADMMKTTEEKADSHQASRYSKLNQVPRVITRRKRSRLIRINGMTRRNCMVYCAICRNYNSCFDKNHSAIRTIIITFHWRTVRCIIYTR